MDFKTAFLSVLTTFLPRSSLFFKDAVQSSWSLSECDGGITQLLAVGESLLPDYPMVADYILEYNLTKCKTI